MKRFALVAALLLLAVPVLAQEATLGTPEQDAALVKLQITGYSCEVANLHIEIHVKYLSQDGTRIVFRRLDWFAANVTGLNDWHTAIGNARVNETGTANRRMNYRILGFVLDKGLLPANTTLTP